MPTPYWNEKQKRWQLNIQHNGKRKTFTSPNPSRKTGPAECKRKASNWLDGYADKSSWRMDKCWNEYLADVKARTSEDNYIQVEKWGRLYVVPRLGLMRIGRISDQDWQDCITRVEPAHGKQLSKKTLSNIRGTIAGFWRYAKRSRMIDAIPDPLLLPTNAPEYGKPIATPAHLTALFQPSTEWYINAWRLMAVTGMRPGETYGLKRDDIGSDRIRVFRAINSRNKETKGKNRGKKRDALLSLIAEVIISEQKDQLIASAIVTPWLFPEPDGDMPNHRKAYKAWQKFSKERGITVPPYSLRHTFVSVGKDIPEATMKRAVGHTKNMDTYGVYDKEVDGELKNAAAIIDDIFGRYL